MLAGVPQEQNKRLQRTVHRRYMRPLGQLMPTLGRQPDGGAAQAAAAQPLGWIGQLAACSPRTRLVTVCLLNSVPMFCSSNMIELYGEQGFGSSGRTGLPFVPLPPYSVEGSWSVVDPLLRHHLPASGRANGIARPPASTFGCLAGPPTRERCSPAGRSLPLRLPSGPAPARRGCCVSEFCIIQSDRGRVQQVLSNCHHPQTGRPVTTRSGYGTVGLCATRLVVG